MQRAAWLLAAFFAAGVMMTTFTDSDAGGDEPTGKVLRHIVLYQFKEGLPPEQLQEVIDTFAGLPEKIDTIIGFEHGTNVSEEGKSEGLTYCFMVTFRNEYGREVYLKHPAHLAYVDVVKDRREKVVVFDYWSEP